MNLSRKLAGTASFFGGQTVRGNVSEGPASSTKTYSYEISLKNKRFAHSHRSVYDVFLCTVHCTVQCTVQGVKNMQEVVEFTSNALDLPENWSGLFKQRLAAVGCSFRELSGNCLQNASVFSQNREKLYSSAAAAAIESPGGKTTTSLSRDAPFLYVKDWPI